MNQETKSLSTQKKIREVALNCFREKGFDNTTVKEICEKSGYSIGAFYHHFLSKASILDDVYSEFDVHLLNEINKKKYNSSSEEILAIMSEQSKQISSNDYQLVSTLFKEQLSFGTKYILNKHRYEINELIRLIEVGKNTNEFKNSIDCVEIANAIFRISIGDVYVWCLQKGSTDLVATVLLDINFILLSIKKK